MNPTITQLEPMSLRGLARQFTPDTKQEIMQLWADAVPLLHTTPGFTGDVVYGVTIDMAVNDGKMESFTYMPAMQIEPGSANPDWATMIDVPAGKYAVFTFDGHISGFPAWIMKVWTEGLAANGLRHRAAPDFERYDSRWNPETSTGPVDYYIPVE